MANLKNLDMWKNNIEIFSNGATITGFNYSKGKNVEINIFKINFK